MGSFIQGLAAANRYLRQRFAALPSKAPAPALLQVSRVTTAWLAGFAGNYWCPRPLFWAYILVVLLEVRLIYGWRTATWLEGQERSPAPRNVSKGWQRRMCQVPEIPFSRVLLGQIHLQIWNLERQLSLSRHFLTSLGVILIIEHFKHVRQKWIKLNSLLKLPEASQLRNEFL